MEPVGDVSHMMSVSTERHTQKKREILYGYFRLDWRRELKIYGLVKESKKGCKYLMNTILSLL